MLNKGQDGPPINEEISSSSVRLVDENGEMKGVMPTERALELANNAGLDLVAVSPNAEPPVCKIMDYGKFRYEAQKKAREARKNQKIVHIKEVKVRPNIGQHDYDVKLKNAKKFLENGDKVKVSLRFRGREITHKELGEELLTRFAGDLTEAGKIEVEPKMEGRQMILMLAPL